MAIRGAAGVDEVPHKGEKRRYAAFMSACAC